MVRQGKCVNFGNCSKANNGELIPILGPESKCPECGLPLVVVDKSKPWLKWLLVLLPLAIAIAALVSFCVPPGNPVIDSENSCSYGKNPDGSCQPGRPCTFGKNPDGSCKTRSCPNGTNADATCELPPPPPPQACTLKPVTGETKPNWYAVVEIGSKGIKPIAVEFVSASDGRLTPHTYDKRSTYNPNPRDEGSIGEVVNDLCEIINSLHTDYGDIPVYLVGSSSVGAVNHRERLDKAIAEGLSFPSLRRPSSGEAVDYLSAEREAEYLAKGIWVPPLPTARHCQSSVVDVGSGNIKGGYVERCNPKRNSGADEQFVTFEIPEFGTTAFTKRSPNIEPYKDAAKMTRLDLSSKMDEQLRQNPDLLRNKTRIYVVGGAVWALNTMLCLDCPQYRGRSITDDINEYTVIKPSDIEEYYRFVTDPQKHVCSAEENPYIRANLDGNNATLPRDKSEIDRHEQSIARVCEVFNRKDLVSAAEIMRTLADKLQISDRRKLFFMQDNLYTWSRQYLIEKLQRL